jgi:Fur family transcriptional regulator, ferric uptake regulator
VAIPSATEFVEQLRPAGGRRSSKRDFIVNAFLRQEGHIGADALVDLIRAQDPRISRATIYRTLQWMVEAGIARRVDFGAGRFRFEHAYRHPRHFHLICKTCQRSLEFLSSDIETLLEEIAAIRNFSPQQSVIQVYGTCADCSTGATQAAEALTEPSVPNEAVFARDALRMAIATERSGREFYSRAAKLTRNGRGRRIFQKLAGDEDDHLARLEGRYRELLAQYPTLETQPTFLFFKGAANGLFSAGADELKKGVDDRKALLIGMRCERGSHQFFKRYGERFEESEGKRVFLEFADEEREHLELLTREHRALLKRQGTGRRNARSRRVRPSSRRVRSA